MAKTLQISEYVPRGVLRIKRICKMILAVCFAGMVLLFLQELKAVDELRMQCDRFEERALRYTGLVEAGDAACEAGDRRQGEQYYLAALEINEADYHIYLKLSKIYREFRYYDLALEILEEYQGNEEEVDAAARALRSEITQLEVSKFRESEK